MERPATITRVQSTTEKVEAILRQGEPDPVALAFVLGYQPAAIAKLRDKHGDRLLVHLKRVWKQRQEQPRFLAKQQGNFPPLPSRRDQQRLAAGLEPRAEKTHAGQYVDDSRRGIDDLEAVDDEWLDRFNVERDKLQADKAARAQAWLEAQKRALDQQLSDPDFKRAVGKVGWVLLTTHDRAIRHVRRRAA